MTHNNIVLNIQNTSSDKVIHVAVHVNSLKDNGVLYFTNNEWESFLEVMQNSNAVVEVNDQRYVGYEEEYS